jgi:NDP-sugar pyrophosphorylase family protein
MGIPAIILAAGEGRRIWPYNEVRSKAAIPIANRPAIRLLVQSLRESGIGEIVVVVGWAKGSVLNALRGIDNIRFAVQREWRAGTADAAVTGLQELGGVPDGPFLVAYGDLLLSPQDVTSLLDEFEKGRPYAAALVAPLGRERGEDWICARVKDGRVEEIEGHTRGGWDRIGGVFVFRPEMKEYLEKNPGVFSKVPVGVMPPLESDIAMSIQMAIEDGMDVAAVMARGPYSDMDKPWHILEANYKFLDYISKRLERDEIHPSAKIHPSAQIGGKVVMDEGSSIGPNVIVEGNVWIGKGATLKNGAIVGGDVVIGAGSSVRNYCQVGGHSVIGNRCIVGHGAEIDGILFDGVYLYHYCEMFGVIGCSTDIGAATVCGSLRFDDREKIHEIMGRKELPPFGANAVYIGDYCRTGVNATIMPGCKIGSYSIVGPGVILYEDLPSRTLVMAKQELSRKEWGPSIYGW